MSESNEKYQKAELSTELSESTRTVIIKALQDGESAITIAKDLRTARSTVYRIKDRYVGRMARKGDRPNWAVAATIDGGISKLALMRVLKDARESSKKANTMEKDAKTSN
ncbi:hypothetical protein N7475_008688 [Penicillium sp. IBT 31633x]|nr:hypothetical protein N7475_008688 [Penicillium sp. IBT 31633x]